MTTGRDVADAVLHEGYVLYPYRASSTKNRYRWVFGVLAPQAWTAAGGCEPSWMETQVLLESGAEAEVDVTLRCLQIRRRRVERFSGGSFGPADWVRVGERVLVAWDEGETREIAFRHAVGASEARHAFALEPARSCEEVRDDFGAVIARVTRESAKIRGEVHVRCFPVGEGLRKLVVRVENLTEMADLQASRDAALPSCCIGSHLLLSSQGGTFVSVLDPPAHLREEAGGCRSVRAFPVLLGPAGRRDSMLASPIILYDHPQIAPESPGDFYDAAEIDELLALRTANLTPEEKREARATDEKAAAIVDRVDHLPQEMMERLHGAMRDLDRAEMVPKAPRSAFAPGMRVRLRPGARRTDAQDLLYAGRIARVEELRTDVDDQLFLAVTLEDDPAAEMHRWYGRFHYYYPDEVEPVS